MSFQLLLIIYLFHVTFPVSLTHIINPQGVLFSILTLLLCCLYYQGYTREARTPDWTSGKVFCSSFPPFSTLRNANVQNYTRCLATPFVMLIIIPLWCNGVYVGSIWFASLNLKCFVPSVSNCESYYHMTDINDAHNGIQHLHYSHNDIHEPEISSQVYLLISVINFQVRVILLMLISRTYTF